MNEIRGEGTGANPENTLWAHGDISELLAENARLRAECDGRQQAYNALNDEVARLRAALAQSQSELSVLQEALATNAGVLIDQAFGDTHPTIYGGQWVAYSRSGLVGHGWTLPEAVRAAQENGFEIKDLRFFKASSGPVSADPDGTAAYEYVQALERVAEKARKQLWVNDNWSDLEDALAALDARRESK